MHVAHYVAHDVMMHGYDMTTSHIQHMSHYSFISDYSLMLRDYALCATLPYIPLMSHYSKYQQFVLLDTQFLLCATCC